MKKLTLSVVVFVALILKTLEAGCLFDCCLRWRRKHNFKTQILNGECEDKHFSNYQDRILKLDEEHKQETEHIPYNLLNNSLKKGINEQHGNNEEEKQDSQKFGQIKIKSEEIIAIESQKKSENILEIESQQQHELNFKSNIQAYNVQKSQQSQIVADKTKSQISVEKKRNPLIPKKRTKKFTTKRLESRQISNNKISLKKQNLCNKPKEKNPIRIKRKIKSFKSKKPNKSCPDLKSEIKSKKNQKINSLMSKIEQKENEFHSQPQIQQDQNTVTRQGSQSEYPNDNNVISQYKGEFSIIKEKSGDSIAKKSDLNTDNIENVSVQNQIEENTQNYYQDQIKSNENFDFEEQNIGQQKAEQVNQNNTSQVENHKNFEINRFKSTGLNSNEFKSPEKLQADEDNKENNKLANLSNGHSQISPCETQYDQNNMSNFEYNSLANFTSLKNSDQKSFYNNYNIPNWQVSQSVFTTPNKKFSQNQQAYTNSIKGHNRIFSEHQFQPNYSMQSQINPHRIVLENPITSILPSNIYAKNQLQQNNDYSYYNNNYKNIITEPKAAEYTDSKRKKDEENMLPEIPVWVCKVSSDQSAENKSIYRFSKGLLNDYGLKNNCCRCYSPIADKLVIAIYPNENNYDLRRFLSMTSLICFKCLYVIDKFKNDFKNYDNIIEYLPTLMNEDELLDVVKDAKLRFEGISLTNLCRNLIMKIDPQNISFYEGNSVIYTEKKIFIPASVSDELSKSYFGGGISKRIEGNRSDLKSDLFEKNLRR